MGGRFRLARVAVSACLVIWLGLVVSRRPSSSTSADGADLFLTSEPEPSASPISLAAATERVLSRGGMSEDARAETSEPEPPWISAGERAFLCGKPTSNHGPIRPPPFSPKLNGTPPLRWLHVPKTGTSFGNTVYHHACPSIPREASLGAGVHANFELKFVKKYVGHTWPRS